MKKFLQKKVVLPTLAGLLLAGTAFSVHQAYAQSGNGPFTGLASAIAQKFNLNQSEVQSEITQYFQSQKANFAQNMQQRITSRLNQEVSQGKINSGQETKIENELTSLKGQFSPQSTTGLTPAQRGQKIQTEMSDLKTWAQSQNINMSLIPFGWHRGPGFMGFKRKPTPTP